MPPEEYSHIIVPDTKVVDDYLELFELPDLKNIVLAQTTVQFVSPAPNQNNLNLHQDIVNSEISDIIMLVFDADVKLHYFLDLYPR